MTYFDTALLTGALLGVLSGLVGVLVVLRRRAFFTVALTHATFPGGVVAAVLGVNVVLGAGVFGIGLVALMVWLTRIRRQGSQVAAGVVLSLGYALGMFLLSINPQLPVKVDSFLTGNILAIAPANVALIAIALAVVVVAYLGVGKELLYSTFDRRGFVAAGYRESITDLAALGLITMTVVVVMPAIGSILAIAMLAAPAAAARLVTRRIGPMLALAAVFGVLSAVAGLVASRVFALAAGGSIALAATAVFLLALAWSRTGGRLVGTRLGGADAGESAAGAVSVGSGRGSGSVSDAAVIEGSGPAAPAGVDANGTGERERLETEGVRP